MAVFFVALRRGLDEGDVAVGFAMQVEPAIGEAEWTRAPSYVPSSIYLAGFEVDAYEQLAVGAVHVVADAERRRRSRSAAFYRR